jgi:hypothetical protein
MSGAIHPLLQYAFMAWCLVKAQGQLYLFTFFYLSLFRKPGWLCECRLGYRLCDRGSIPDTSYEGNFFLFSTASRLALGPTQPPIQWVLGAPSPEGGREADQSPSPKLRISGAIPPLPPSVFMAWCLVKQRDNFIFTLYL